MGNRIKNRKREPKYDRYFQAIRSQRTAVAGALALSSGGVLTMLALPWPLKVLVDGVLTGEAPLDLIAAWSVHVQVIVISSALLLALRSNCLHTRQGKSSLRPHTRTIWPNITGAADPPDLRHASIRSAKRSIG